MNLKQLALICFTLKRDGLPIELYVGTCVPGYMTQAARANHIDSGPDWWATVSLDTPFSVTTHLGCFEWQMVVGHDVLCRGKLS